MPATIVKGATFSSTVTAGGLHGLVESATISSIDRANIKSDSTVASLSATPLTAPLDNEAWQDSLSNFPMTYDQASGVWLPALSVGSAYTLATGALAVSPGSLLFPSNEGSSSGLFLSDFSGRSSDFVAGVATAAVSPGAKGVAITQGVAKVLSTGTVSAGRSVDVSVAGLAQQASGSAGSGFGALVFGVALEAASGGKVWINLRR